MEVTYQSCTLFITFILIIMPVIDYSTECGATPLTFLQMLAATIRGYHDIAGVLHYRLNRLVSGAECAGLSDFLTCATSDIEPERQLV